MKRARGENVEEGDQATVAVCSICLDKLHSTVSVSVYINIGFHSLMLFKGKHRSVVLVCGHVFGKKCIASWMEEKKRNSECPQCKAPFKKKEVRDVFLPSGSVLDASETERLRKELFQTQVRRRKNLLSVLNEEQKETASRNEAVFNCSVCQGCALG